MSKLNSEGMDRVETDCPMSICPEALSWDLAAGKNSGDNATMLTE